LAIVLVAAAVLSGLAVSTPANAADTLNYRLKWIFNASVVGDIYADVRGHFAEQGLQVEVKEGGPERDAIRELEIGRAQFGVASADQVIRALSKGASVVVIAQLFQINPLQWIYRTDEMQIRRLENLKGKTLGVTFGGNDEAILRTLLAKAGLTEKDVTLFSVRYDYTPLYKREVNFWPVYRNTQAVFLSAQLKEAGEPYDFFNPADYGVQFVANSVVTSERMLKEHRDTVIKFNRALLAGWRAALKPENSSKAIEVLQLYDKDSAEAVLKEQLSITRGLIKPDADTRIGQIDTAAWQQTETIMLSQKQIGQPVNVTRALKQMPLR
jgi:NitT/TauT family transport system substrate-binding protein